MNTMIIINFTLGIIACAVLAFATIWCNQRADKIDAFQDQYRKLCSGHLAIHELSDFHLEVIINPTILLGIQQGMMLLVPTSVRMDAIHEIEKRRQENLKHRRLKQFADANRNHFDAGKDEQEWLG